MRETVQIEDFCCLNCGKPIKGRPDKKFCDPGCKNVYNNRLQRIERAEINRIDLVLKRNRRVLKRCLGAGSSRVVSRPRLLQAGFHFEYHTHIFENSRKQVYFFSYNYGYRKIDEDQFLVVKSFENDQAV